MSWLEIGVVSLEQYFCHHSSSIEFFEHFHSRRSDKSFGIFFIDESFTESMKSLNIHTKCISTDEAPESIPHSKRSGFCIGESEYISRRSICFCQNIGYSEREELCLSCTGSSDDDNRAIDSIYSLFLSSIKSGISGFKWVHRIRVSVSKRRGKSRLICLKVSTRF